MKTNEQIFRGASRLEWDGLLDETTYDGPFRGGNILPGTEKITIHRDGDYNVAGYFIGTRGTEEASGHHASGLPPVHDLDIKLHWAFLKLQRCKITNINTQSIARVGHEKLESVDAKFDVRSVDMEVTGKDRDTLGLCEWYINGPRNICLFHEPSKRVSTIQYEHRLGKDGCNGVDRFKIGESNEATSGDHFFVQIGDLKFCVHRVPEKYAPDWSPKLAIQYRLPWGGIPSVENRQQIAEVIGFVFGRRLVRIGETILCNEGFVLAQKFESHGVQNIKRICGDLDLPPVRHRMDSSYRVENLIEALLPAYLTAQPLYCLREALRRRWLSRTMPSGINVLVLATGLEMIADHWFRSSGSKTKGLNLSRDEFQELLMPESAALLEKLKKVQHGEKIYNRILGANRMGATERIEQFFAEIDLPFGRVEKQLVKERNRFAHGAVISDPERAADANRVWFCYLTLFNRVVLRLLNASCGYIDFTTDGAPERPLSDPLGGTELQTAEK